MNGIAIKSSDVRDKFSSVVDDVIRKGPRVVTRTRDQFVMINLEHMESLVSEIRFHVTIEKDEDESYIASLAEIPDLLVSEESIDDSVASLAKQLIAYAKEYLEESFTMYFNSPNRKKHFPYVLKVMLQNSNTDVIKLFNVEFQRS